MKICTLSDLHGFLPDKIPECDLLILGGDYSPFHKLPEQCYWLGDIFAKWLAQIPETTKVVGIAGNHDGVFQKWPESLPVMNWTYLQDDQFIWNDLKIWGTPWQPYYYNYAFQGDEEFLKHKWQVMPDDVDILIVHGPPHGYGDLVGGYYVNGKFREKHRVGSPTLTERILEVQPKLVVTGHIHEDYGIHYLGDIVIVNASYVDEKLNPVHEPIVIGLDDLV